MTLRVFHACLWELRGVARKADIALHLDPGAWLRAASGWGGAA